MNVQITARKFKASDSLKEFAESELKSLEKYFEPILDAEVVLSYIHPKESIKKAEIILNVPKRVVKSEVESDDFKKSISSAVEKCKRQLKKIKTQLTEH